MSKRFKKIGSPNQSAYKFPTTMNNFFYQSFERSQSETGGRGDPRAHNPAELGLSTKKLLLAKVGN